MEVVTSTVAVGATVDGKVALAAIVVDVAAPVGGVVLSGEEAGPASRNDERAEAPVA